MESTNEDSVAQDAKQDKPPVSQEDVTRYIITFLSGFGVASAIALVWLFLLFLESRK